jgi:hypothetical protein
MVGAVGQLAVQRMLAVRFGIEALYSRYGVDAPPPIRAHDP